MSAYSYSKARKQRNSLLDLAADEGEARIRRKNGQVFIVRPEYQPGSPLDVEGVDLGVSTAEIVTCIREMRERELHCS